MRCVSIVFMVAFAIAAAASDKKIVCYFGSWSVSTPGDGKFDISNIDPTICTHMIYAFVGVTEDGDIRVMNPSQDLPDDNGQDGFGRFNNLRTKNPQAKTIIAVGGASEPSIKFSNVVSDPAVRKRFVENAVNFVKEYEFDGFDVDWEYPSQNGGAPSDRENYVLLLKELRERFDTEGLLLTTAVGAHETSAAKSYIIPEVAKYVHFINLMTYDLNGSWNKRTGINAPLYAGSGETEAQKEFNVDAAVKYWISQGADPKNLIVGVAFYGRTFTLDDPSNNGVGAPASHPGEAAPYTNEPGYIGYNEICQKLGTGQWETHYQEEQKVPYMVRGNQWIGYDDVKSLTEKTKYVNDHGLGGIMIWSVELDDFRGSCGEKFPLLKAVKNTLR